MSDTAKGIWALVLAFATWGLSGAYYKVIAHVPAPEVLAHRSLWGMVFLGLVLAAQGRLGQARAVLADRRMVPLLALAAVMIALNWGGFIVAIQLGWALEASLGYYIFPLVAAMLGYLVLGERIGPTRAWAVVLAGAAVALLVVGLGVVPWVALFIAITFGLYSLIKARIGAGPVLSVFAELVVLAPLALIWLAGAHLAGWSVDGRAGAWFGQGPGDTLMLMFAGVLTALPLILFSYGARRVTLTTTGLVQYLNPTLQFLVAILLFAEPLGGWHLLAFALIWAALAIYSWDGWRAERRRARNSGTVSTT